ncbi:hypothetical protein [Bradyrhizobium sp. USDA 4473]
MICAFNVSSTTRSNDDARALAVLGDVVKLGDQRGELLVQRLALRDLLSLFGIIL